MPATIGDLLSNLTIPQTASETPKRDLEILLCHIIDQNRAYLYAHSDSSLTSTQFRAFSALLERRIQGEPIAYLIGHQGFWQIELEVDERVLIPRPETELLVEMALEIDVNKVTSAVDLGTGSGAIAIVLALKRPCWQLSATDISAEALTLAKRNALLNDAHIEFIEGNWCEALTSRRFDLVISNPPYIDPADPHLLTTTLGYEPANALVARDNGLADLRAIITGAKQHLNKSGWIILEHGYDQSNEVCAMLLDNDYQSIQPRKDIEGRDRAVIAQAPGK